MQAMTFSLQEKSGYLFGCTTSNFKKIFTCLLCKPQCTRSPCDVCACVMLGLCVTHKPNQSFSTPLTRQFQTKCFTSLGNIESFQES